MKDIKIVFIDIDGTLTDDNENVSVDNKNAIESLVNMGTKVVLCTGRSDLYTIRKSMEALASNYVITSNGAHVYDYINNSSIYLDEISYDSIKEVYDYCNNNGLSLIMNGVAKRYKNYATDNYMKYSNNEHNYDGGFSIDVNYSNDIYISNLTNKIKILYLEEYLKNDSY